MQFCAYQPYANTKFWPLHKSEVFYDLKTIDGSTAILKRMSAENLQKQLITSISYTFDSNHSEHNSSNALFKQTLQRTPSPILLSYCKEILDNFDVSVKPVYKDGEPFLSHDDAELLSQIVKSNDNYHYLSENHTKLLKTILEMNFCHQAKNKEESSSSKESSTSSSNKKKSEFELLETILLEEVSTGDELELSWCVVEEIFSRRNKAKDESSESINLQDMCDTPLQDTLSETSRGSENEKLSISNAPSSVSTSTEDYDILEKDVLLGVTKIRKIPDCEILATTETKSDAQFEPLSKRGRIFETEDTLSSTDFLDDLVSDNYLSSDDSTPVPPPSDILSSETQLPNLPTTGQDYSFPEISTNLPISYTRSNLEFSSSNEDLYTDQVFRRTEAKLLDAISHRLAYTPQLPMSLSVKTINLLDIRRRRVEFYRLQVEVPQFVVVMLHNLQLSGFCAEYEIRQFTFSELAQLGHFYKIEQTKNGVTMRQTNLQEIVFNPEHLLGMLRCKRKPTISETLADKIRGSYDSTKYAAIFEDIMELDLYSAKSQSESDFEDIDSSHFPKKHNESEVSGEDRLNFETVNFKRIGVLFDNNQYGNQNSSRSKFYTDDAIIDDGVVDESQTEVLNALLEKFYEVDPLTIGDLVKYINKLKTNFQEDMGVECPDEDSLCSKPSSCSFSSATSGFLSAQ